MRHTLKILSQEQSFSSVIVITGGLKKRRHSQSDHLSCSLCTSIILIISGTANKIQPVIRQNCPSKRRKERAAEDKEEDSEKEEEEEVSQKSTQVPARGEYIFACVLYHHHHFILPPIWSIDCGDREEEEKEEGERGVQREHFFKTTSLTTRNWRQEHRKRRKKRSKHIKSIKLIELRQAGRQAVQTSCATQWALSWDCI